MTLKTTKESKSILENHEIFKYEFESREEAFDKLSILRSHQAVFLNKHPSFRINIKFILTESTNTIIIETWTFPGLLNN